MFKISQSEIFYQALIILTIDVELFNNLCWEKKNMALLIKNGIEVSVVSRCVIYVIDWFLSLWIVAYRSTGTWKWTVLEEVFILRLANPTRSTMCTYTMYNLFLPQTSMSPTLLGIWGGRQPNILEFNFLPIICLVSKTTNGWRHRCSVSANVAI